ncbi:MAG: hypothetical protein MJK15_00765 [Colwellia sp.]|nr:hypothetical protein [Colwellia sp.]
MNIVQSAYNTLKAHQVSLEQLDLTDEPKWDAYLAKDKELARAVWLAVAELTAKVNPSLKREVERGNYDEFYLYSTNMCFLDSNWAILDNGKNCTHCGVIHNES